jgi:phosphoribosylamine--glycine ligase
MTAAMIERTMDEIVRPTVRAMAARGAPFRGVFYAGLMITAAGPKLIEYNVRFGDPECQPLMMRLDSDLIDLLTASIEGRLDTVEATWSEDAALCVVMASNGYPGAYEKGCPLSGIEAAEALEDVTVFHAGTATRDGALVASGGRVLGVTARGETIAAAQIRAYEAVERIDFAAGFCRRDIGFRAVGR